MDDAKEEIKARLAVEDVVGQYIELKRAGRNLKGRSPWGVDKTPSFMVSPEKGIWHDFSANKGGDIFTFIMEVEGIPFREALEKLAAQAGVELKRYSGGDKEVAKKKARAKEALELATKYYQVCLTKNKPVCEYVFYKRNLNRATVLEFRIGYSPNQGKALHDFLRKKGFSEQEIEAAGLLNRFGGDLFRGRMMVPFIDTNGQVIGYTARIVEKQQSASSEDALLPLASPDDSSSLGNRQASLPASFAASHRHGTPSAARSGAPSSSHLTTSRQSEENKGPKYLNTPETLLFNKSRFIFGLYQAKEAIRREGFVVIVEGNMDVISSHQAGVKQAVATSGTAMTEQHLKILSRLTNDVRLAYDGDEAGVKATERAINLAGGLGVNLTVISDYHGAKDPDELIQKSADLWKQAVSERRPAVEWLLDKYEEKLDLNTGAGKREYSDVAMRVIAYLKDPVERKHYEQMVAKRLEVEVADLVAKKVDFEKKPKRLKTVKTSEQGEVEGETVGVKRLRGIEDNLLAIMLYGGEAGAGVNLEIPEDEARLAELEMVYENRYKGWKGENLRKEAEDLMKRRAEGLKKMKIAELSAELEEVDEERGKEILREIMRLQRDKF